MNRNTPKPEFYCARQRPTQALDEVEQLGRLDFADFIKILRNVDWRHEANQAEWAKKAVPTIAVTNRNDQCTFWVSAVIAGSIIDVSCEPDEQLRTDANEPWFSVGLENAPAISNVVAIKSHSDDEYHRFITASLETVEECFGWFFEEDYESLYALFRWV